MLKRGYSLEGKFYRAKVVENNDPLRLGRIRVRVIPIMEEVKDSDCPWATPCWGGGVVYIPPVNAWVWVFFEEGDVERPVWMGWSTPFNETRHRACSTREEFGKGAMDAGGMIEEVGGGYPYTVVIRSPVCTWIAFLDDGTIVIKARRIVLAGDTDVSGDLRVLGNLCVTGRIRAKGSIKEHWQGEC
jgi:hypothetical protein